MHLMHVALSALKDIEGVLGSFFVDTSGELLSRDMPLVFDEGTLEAASLRLARLRAALEDDAASFEGCVARFGQHLLVLKPVGRRTLCVLVPRGANLKALQMGTNLVTRRLASLSAPDEAPSRASAPPGTLGTSAREAVPPHPRVASVPAAPWAPLSSSTSIPIERPSSLPSTQQRPSTPPPAQTSAPPSVQRPAGPSAPPSAMSVDPSPTRQLTKRFFRGRPVP